MMDGAKVRGLLQANQRLIDGETPGDSSLQKSHTHWISLALARPTELYGTALHRAVLGQRCRRT